MNKSSGSQEAAQLKTIDVITKDHHEDSHEVQELLVNQVVLVNHSSPASLAPPGKGGVVGLLLVLLQRLLQIKVSLFVLTTTITSITLIRAAMVTVHSYCHGYYYLSCISPCFFLLSPHLSV